MPEGTIERPLSPSLPRDCGHECRVCKVKVVSLTEYASHISSPTHKQNVDAAETQPAGINQDEDYFDQALVDLIEKRNREMREEKEAAAVKLAKEEEDRRKKEEFHQRLKKAQERYRLDRVWQLQGFSGSSCNNAWRRFSHNNGSTEGVRPWQHNNKQERSATWHAQDPPDFKEWASGEFSAGSNDSQVSRSNKTWGYNVYPGNQKSRLPWLSNEGSSYGLYGHNNISSYTHKSQHQSYHELPAFQTAPRFYAPALNRFQSTGNIKRHLQNAGPQNETLSTESDHNSSRSSKTGSNQKLDRVCRWSPYSTPNNDTPSNTSEKHQKTPKHQKQDASDSNSSHTQHELKSGHYVSSRHSEEEIKRLQVKPRFSITTGNSSQADGSQNSVFSASSQRTDKPFLHVAQKNSSVPGVRNGAKPSKASSQHLPQSKLTAKQSQVKESFRSSQSGQEKQLPESFSTSRQGVSERKDSVKSRMKITRHTEEQNIDQGHNHIEENKDKNQNGGKLSQPVKHMPEKSAPTSSDKFVQSVQVTTSTTENTDPAGSVRNNDEKRKKVEKQTCSAVPDEAMQVTEAGQSSESDTSRSEAQMVRGTNASTLSKLDLPPVLKRDLTKHMSSKSKPAGHEPNLNIARRVRNLSETRRSDTEKDSGLKPTVMQLISSSGSRRSVNWDQVYQEFRKKQDKGKGMPRFGIEMVPNEQEGLSQEENDLHFLEGLQWESMDMSSQDTSRKRSLSESSLAPCSAPSLSEETTCLSSDQPTSTVPVSVPEKPDHQCQAEATAQKQSDKLTYATLKDLQRSDSVLSISSSETEQYDAQGKGKRRRAAGEVPDTEASCLEHNSKRRKVKSKRERLQINQLLTVSLREEELSRSLQNVDTSLIQARAALEAAYMEVQRLMVYKQQITVEMGTLRNKRIELLKGMQGTLKETPLVKLKEENMSMLITESPPMSSSVTCQSVLDTAAAPADHSAEHTPPPSSSLPLSVVIKEEPKSPVQIGSELTNCAHTTTPEPPATTSPGNITPEPPATTSLGIITPEPPATTSLGIITPEPPATTSLGIITPEPPATTSPGIITPEPPATTSPGIITPEPPATTSPDPVWKLPLTPEIKHEPDQSNCVQPADCREKLPALVETTEKALQSSSLQSVQSTSVLNMPTSPSESRNGTRVRKLKKRKDLKKAQGTKQPDTSDTEIDEEVTRPSWLQQRRRPSGSSQVSVSSQATDEREFNMNTEGNKKTLRVPCPAINVEKEEKSSKKMVELSQVGPPGPVGRCEESKHSMKNTAACQWHQMDTLVSPSTKELVPDSCRPEPHCLACNQVSSTSDMDLCKTSEDMDLCRSSEDMDLCKTSEDMDLCKTSEDMDLCKTSEDMDLCRSSESDDTPAEGVFSGHQEAVNAIQIHKGLLYTCSGDRTIKAFDLVSHKCVGVFEGHSSKVTCLLVSAAPGLPHRLYSGSSDQTIRCHSIKTREFEHQFVLPDRVLCLHSRWWTLYAGLANGTVVTFNLRTNKQMDMFECHGRRGVSCLASSQEGAQRILLVGSYDCTISVRAAKTGLLLRTLKGHTKTVLCMTVVNDLVFSGSSDHSVHAYNIHTGDLVHVYKGHSHAVTVVTVLGKVLVTACLDKCVRIYDLQSQEQLQVYGGHKDMVLCMTVHENMIYTGCYDGSVQAVRLNLMQKHRCRWHGCSLVFAMTEHLQHHLMDEHTNTNFQTFKCRWKHCEEFFCTRSSSKQMMLLHMQKHAEEQSGTVSP